MLIEASQTVLEPLPAKRLNCRVPLRVLIIPDKFKGTLTASAAAAAIAGGWRKARPSDRLELLPMTDGGDGFGEIVSHLLGARARRIASVDAAHRPRVAAWWWNAASRTALIESATVIGLALFPEKKLHPFELDTFGLGKLLRTAARHGAHRCQVGVGGSATNDGGFGLARALGWQFLDRNGKEIVAWPELASLAQIVRPKKRLKMRITVAVDVANPLLGPRGCSRVYGPQKGLQPADFALAEKALSRLARICRDQLGKDFAPVPGAGAAGGLGFGLMTFAGARAQSGFRIFADAARLRQRLARADLVLTGEGSIDRSSLMGKGVGELAGLCREAGVRCIGFGGVTAEAAAVRRRFLRVAALSELTTRRRAMEDPSHWLAKLAARVAAETEL